MSLASNHTTYPEGNLYTCKDESHVKERYGGQPAEQSTTFRRPCPHRESASGPTGEPAR